MHSYDAHGLPYFISSSGVMQFREVCYTVVSYAPYILLQIYTKTNLATFQVNIFFACGALAASISVGIVIPSTWFVYLYKQTVSITVVVMGTKQFSDKTTHRQQVKTGFLQKWENKSPGLLQDYSRILPFFKDSISS